MSLETIFWVKILKFFDADPGSGINIPDPTTLDEGLSVWSLHKEGKVWLKKTK